MLFDARQIANWFIRRSRQDGRNLSIMALLKLIYIAHGWHLEVFKTPLIRNRIEAWKFGPVVPEAYADFRKQGILVKEPIDCEEAEMGKSTAALLEEIYSIYSGMDAFKLSEITHVPNGPWDLASKHGYFAEIPNSLIQSHYEELRQNASKAKS